uniref:Ig-like domain-containing protein n=1 Tax=Biomphalaria glabrata TaxID=6526 RepID=A0A2C9KRC4_BIOGL
MVVNNFYIGAGVFLSLVSLSLSQTPIEIKGKFTTLSPSNHIKLGETLKFSCLITTDINSMFSNTFVIYRKDGEKRITLAEKGILLEEADPNYYDVKHTYEVASNTLDIQFTILKVTDEDDGKLYCGAFNSKHTPLMGEQSLDIVVLRPLTNLKLIIDGLDPITSNQDSQIEVKSGSHKVQCIAEGSNPAAKAEVYLHGEQDFNGTVTSVILTEKPKTLRTNYTTYLYIASANTGHDLECKASSEYGDTKSIRVPLKVTVEEPNLNCTDTEAYEGQKDTQIICTVDHHNSKLIGYKYQIGPNVYYPGGDRDEIHFVQTEDWLDDDGSKWTKVILTLQKAENEHFSSDIYLVAEHEDGHMSRMPVKLQRVEGPYLNDEDKEGRSRGNDDNSSNMLTLSVITFWLSLLWSLGRRFF